MLAARFLNVRLWVQVLTKLFLALNIHRVKRSPLVAGRYFTFVDSTRPYERAVVALSRSALYFYEKCLIIHSSDTKPPTDIFYYIRGSEPSLTFNRNYWF